MSWLAACLSALMLLSCAARHPSVVLSGDVAEKLCRSEYGLQHDDVLSALAHMDFVTPEGYYPVKAALVFMRPAYARLEILPVIGSPEFLMTASPEKIDFFIPSRGEFYTGRMTDAHLQKILPVPLALRDMVMILTGTYPPLDEDHVACLVYTQGDEQRIEKKAPSGRAQIMHIRGHNTLTKLIRKDENGAVVFTAEYIYDRKSSAFPAKITIETADKTTSLSVRFSDMTIEKLQDPGLFDLPIPEDARIIFLE